MSLANPFICLIDGTDNGPAGIATVAHASGDCTGVDRIGTAHITVRFPAASGYIYVPTREVQLYIETYTGSTHTGNNPLFGGFVKAEGIKVYNVPSGETVVELDCQDYNCLLDAIQTDLHSTNTDYFTLGADTFEHQVRDMVLAFQKNGRVSSPPSLIDATHNVGAICGAHVFPLLNVQYGLSLRQGLRILMQRAVAFNSALRPRFFLELVDNVSIPAQVICGLVVYDSAAGLPASSLTFAEIPGVGEHTILGTQGVPHTRTLDASMPLANYVQSVWHPPSTDWIKIKTSEGATSEATYYNNYINGGLTSNRGPWKLPLIKDTTSQNDTEAQTVADLARFSKEFPRETFTLIEDGVYVQPGTSVHLRTTNIDQDYEVTAAQFSFPSVSDPTLVRYSLTLGLPLLELFDNSGVDWTKAPILGDFVPPNPPGPPTLISNTYNVDTGNADITVSYAASPSPDTRGYALLIVNTGTGAHYWFADVGTTLQPTVSVPSGIPFSLDDYAFDGANNYSASGGRIAGVTASPTYYALTNPGFETINSLDATMPYAWTKAVTGTGAAQRDTAQHNSGIAAGLISIGAGAGTSAIVCAQVVSNSTIGYELRFYARANSASKTLTWTATWYASDGVTVLGTSTGNVTPPNGSWGRFNAGPVPTANTAFWTLKFSTSGSTAYSIWVDTVFMEPPRGPGGLENPFILSSGQSIVAGNGKVTLDGGLGLVLAADPSVGANAINLNDLDGTNIGLVYASGHDNTNTGVLELKGLTTGTSIFVAGSRDVTISGNSSTGTVTLSAPTLSLSGNIVGTQSGGSGTSFPGSPASGWFFFRTDLNQWCMYDGTRWLGEKLNIYLPFDTNTAGGAATPPVYSANTIISRFHPPTPEKYWVDAMSWWVLVSTTNNSTNFWTLELASEGNTFGGTLILDQDTKGLTAGTPGFVTATSAFSGNPYDFSLTSMYDFFLQVKKTLAPGNLTVYGTSMTLRKVYT